jgi:hypothetical protein
MRTDDRSDLRPATSGATAIPAKNLVSSVADQFIPSPVRALSAAHDAPYTGAPQHRCATRAIRQRDQTVAETGVYRAIVDGS